MFNAGYRVGATRPVLVQTNNNWDTKEMPTFAPVAMAGYSPKLPEDTVSRSIRILRCRTSTTEASPVLCTPRYV